MSSLKIIEDLEEDVRTIKDWLGKQHHLPQNIDDTIIRRFILSCNRSLEKTKQVIDLCYTIRSQAPEIFANRDVLSPEMQHIISLGDILPLPRTTNKNYKLILFRIANKNADNFVFSDVLKIVLMVADVRLVSEFEIADGEIPIFDMSGMSLQHLTKVTLPTLRKYMMYTQEAHPVRLKAIHVINSPVILDKLMMLVKPFLKGEVAAMMYFHSNVDSLNKYIPRDLLPDEYGGKAGKLADIKAEWYAKLLEYRDYMLDDLRWKVNESKRPVNNQNKKSLFGIQGSFRSLTID